MTRRPHSLRSQTGRRPSGRRVRRSWLLVGLAGFVALVGGLALHANGFLWGVPAAALLVVAGLAAAVRPSRASPPPASAQVERQRALSGKDESSQRALVQVVAALAIGGLPLWFILWWYFAGGCYRSQTC